MSVSNKGLLYAIELEKKKQEERDKAEKYSTRIGGTNPKTWLDEHADSTKEDENKGSTGGLSLTLPSVYDAKNALSSKSKYTDEQVAARSGHNLNMNNPRTWLDSNRNTSAKTGTVVSKEAGKINELNRQTQEYANKHTYIAPNGMLILPSIPAANTAKDATETVDVKSRPNAVETFSENYPKYLTLKGLQGAYDATATGLQTIESTAGGLKNQLASVKEDSNGMLPVKTANTNKDLFNQGQRDAIVNSGFNDAKQQLASNVAPIDAAQYGDDSTALGALKNNITSATYNYGYMMPSIILSTITAGAGVAPIANKINATVVGAKIASMVTTGLNTYANAYKNALDDGASYKNASKYALGSSLNESVVDEGFSDTAGWGVGLAKGAISKLSSVIARGYAAKLLEFGVEKVVLEGVSEGAQEYIDYLLRKWTYDPDAEVDWNAVKKAGIQGAMMGAMGGASETAVNRIAGINAYGNAAQTYQQQQAAAQDEKNQKIADVISAGGIDPERITSAGTDRPQSVNISSNASFDSNGNIVLPKVNKTELSTRITTADDIQKKYETSLRTYEQDEILRRASQAKSETERTGILTGASDESISTASRIAEKLGIKVEYFFSDTSGSSVINGYRSSDGVIHINSQSANTPANIIAHELTHSTEGTKQYAALANFVKAQLGDNYDYFVSQKENSYAAADVQLSKTGAESEVIAEYVEKNLLKNETDITSLVKTDMSLAQKVYSWIKSTAKKLFGTPGQKTLARARALFEKAFAAVNETSRQYETAAQYSISEEDFEKMKRDDESKLDAIIAEADTKSQQTNKKAAESERIANMTEEERSEYYKNKFIKKQQRQEQIKKAREEKSKIDSMTNEERRAYLEDRIKQRVSAADRAEVENLLNKSGEAKEKTLSSSGINKAAKNIISDSGSSVARKELSGDLAAIYNMMINGRASDAEVVAAVQNAAGKIVDNIAYENAEADPRYKQIKNYFKDNKITIKPELLHDAAASIGKESWRDLRIAAKGVITKEAGHLTIDQVYPELTEMYGEDLFPSDIITQSGQLQQLISVLGQNTQTVKTYLSDLRDDEIYQTAKADVSNSIIEQYWDIRQTHTAAETVQAKANAEIAGKNEEIRNLKNEAEITREETLSNQRKAARESARKLLDKTMKLNAESAAKLKDRVEKTKTAGENRLEKFKEKTRERARRDTEKASIKDLRQSINTQYHTLSKMLLHPDKNSHLPKQYVSAVSELLSAIDLTTDGQTSKTISKLEDLKTAAAKIYDNSIINSDETMIIDPEMTGRIDGIVSALKEKSIVHMDKEQLNEVRKLLLSVKQSVYNQNRAFNGEQNEHISQIAFSAIDEIRSDKSKKSPAAHSSGIIKHIDNLVNYSTIEPEYMFGRFGKTMHTLYNYLLKAQNIYIKTVKMTSDYMKGVISDNKADMKKWDGDNAEKISVTIEDRSYYGGTDKHDAKLKISLTPAQMISIYLLNKRPQGNAHIIKGGISIVDETTDTQTLAIPVTQEDINNIIKKMSPQMVSVADAMSKYLTTEMSELGNEVSRLLYGYDKFTEPYYFPIIVNKGSLARAYGETKGEASLENTGMTKEIDPNAANAVEIYSAFDVFDRHTVKMAAYNAYVPSLKDLKRVLNTRDLDGETVRSLIDNAYGKNAGNYIDDFLMRINSGKIVNSLWNDNITQKLVRAYKGAAIGFNLSTVIKQPISYIRAGVVINPKYLISALTPLSKKQWNANMKEMLENAPIALLKEWGYADMGFGKNQRQLYDTSTMSFSARMAEISGKLPSIADKLTWNEIWRAVKLEAKAKGKGIDYAAERFREVIVKTQVVNTVFDTSPIMNNDSGLTRFATAFMAEPLKTYNCLYEAVRSGNGKNIARTGAVLLANMAAEAIVSVLFDYYRSTDDEDKPSMEGALRKFGYNMLTNTFILPYIKDIEGLLIGKLTGDNYGGSIMAYEGIEAVYNATYGLGVDLASRFSGNGATTTPAKHLQNIIRSIGMITGVGIYNITRDLSSMFGRIADASGSGDFKYSYDKVFYEPSNTKNRKRYYNLLYSLRGDNAAYNRVMKDLINNYGYDVDSIKQAINDRVRKDQKYITLADATEEGIITIFDDNTLYNTFPDDIKEYANDRAEDYSDAYALYLSGGTSISKNESANKVYEADKLSGISSSDYILYCAELKSIKEKDNATLVEKLKAIENLTWLSDSAKATLYSFASSDTQADKIKAYKDAKLSFDDYADVYRYNVSLEDSGVKGTEKRDDLEAWLKKRGYTSAQQDVILEQLGYSIEETSSNRSRNSRNGRTSRSSRKNRG